MWFCVQAIIPIWQWRYGDANSFSGSSSRRGPAWELVDQTYINLRSRWSATRLTTTRHRLTWVHAHADSSWWMATLSICEMDLLTNFFAGNDPEDPTGHHWAYLSFPRSLKATEATYYNQLMGGLHEWAGYILHPYKYNNILGMNTCNNLPESTGVGS